MAIQHSATPRGELPAPRVARARPKTGELPGGELSGALFDRDDP